jgi:hypothetical protein
MLNVLNRIKGCRMIDKIHDMMEYIGDEIQCIYDIIEDIYDKMTARVENPKDFLDDYKDSLFFLLTPIPLTIMFMESQLYVNKILYIPFERAEQAASLLPGVTLQEIKQAGLDTWGKTEELDCVRGYREHATQLNVLASVLALLSWIIAPIFFARSLLSHRLERKSKKTISLFNSLLTYSSVLFCVVPPTQLRERYSEEACLDYLSRLLVTSVLAESLWWQEERERTKEKRMRQREKKRRGQRLAKISAEISVLLRFVVKTSKKEGNAFNSLPKTVVSDFILPYLAPPRLLSQALKNKEAQPQSDMDLADAVSLGR